MSSRLEIWLRGSRIPVLRDVVSKRPSSGRNLDALDGLRGFAVLQVIAAHTQAFGQAGHGAVGVWLFFTLSAFLLTLPFAAHPERLSDPARLRHYATRRFRRILPAYWLLLAYYFTVQGVSGKVIVEHVLFLRGDNHLWTIPQEMLFYVLLPLLALPHRFVFRGRFALTALWLAGVAVACFLWLDRELFAMQGTGKVQRFHAGVFVTGMVAGFVYSDPRIAAWAARPRVQRVLGPLAGFGVLFLLLSAPTLQAHIPGLSSMLPPMGWFYPGLYAVVSSLLLCAILWTPGGWLHRVFANPLLRLMGILSYSLYLFHLNVIAGLKDEAGFTGAALFAATVFATAAIALLVYSGVERPFLVARRAGRPAEAKPPG